MKQWPAPQSNPAHAQPTVSLSVQSRPDLLKGLVERVTYHNSENGYCVLRVKISGARDLMTVTGHVTAITPGESIEAQGTWTQHREFGRQFQADQIRNIHPSSIEGIEKYLGSGLVKGIGPHFAKKLVREFGTQVFDVIEKEPHRLKQVRGIGPVRIQKISGAWKDQKFVREIMVFLQSHGVSTGRAVRIYKTYGEQAIEKVKQDPYQLARDIQGIGFKSADLIASHLGISKTSLIRARAGVHHVLYEKVSEGHCAFPEDELLTHAEKLLEIDVPTLKQGLEFEVVAGHFYRQQIEDRACVYPISIYRSEREVSELLLKLMRGEPRWGKIDSEKALPWVEQKLGMELAALQRDAIATVLQSKLSIITGGPGTGKTTLTRALLTILKAKNVQILLCSPTGRAAKRLSEVSGLEAKTIHRLLGYDPQKQGFLHGRDNPLLCDFLLIDEASMVDISLLFSLLKAVPPHAALVFVGDVDQLPSVGPGCVLGSMIGSGVIPTVKLTQIFRQAAQSKIVLNAHRVNRGDWPELENGSEDLSDFYFVSCETPEEAALKLIELVKNRIPHRFHLDPIRDIQVLCPMNRGRVGARSLNHELQLALNPSPTVKIEKFGLTYSPGDKIMVVANDYDKEVFNGDIGYITHIDIDEQEVWSDFDGRKVIFDFDELDLITLAYATTIHKSQGSEYPAVVIPILTQHYLMLNRNLLYTGMTRGRKLVVLLGQKKAIRIAIKVHGDQKRWNALTQRLQV